jgi:hypothetical protein
MCRAWFAGVLLAAGCSFEAASLPTGFADGPVVVIDASIVDVPGAGADAVPGIDAPRVPDAAIVPDARICIPGCVSENSLRVCPSDTVIDCVLGCVSTGTPHCGVQIPSNGIPSNVYNGTGPFVVPTGRTWRVNVDNGEIVDSMSGQVRPQGTGVDAGSGIGYFQIGNMGVFSASLITIADGATVRAFGLVRSLAMVTSGNAVVDGLLNVSAESCTGVDLDLNCPGPGGGIGGVTGVAAGGCGPGGSGQAGAVDETGGGGGGFGAVGAVGGDVIVGDGSGGNAGSMCGTVTLVPLVGGSGGGHGGNGGNGGGGGGAVQITSFGQIIVSGTIQASGAGGLFGGDGDGGGGGGAGGGILLEAPAVTLSPGSVMAANGGGGGAGNAGENGQTGLGSAAAAAGGAGGGDGFDGGAGGALGVAAMPGSRGTDGAPADGTGAGGGGVGRIRQNFATLSTNGTIVSPAASLGKVPVQ